MIIYDYVSRAKLKSSHTVFSLKREYDNRRGAINVEARKEASSQSCAQILQPQVQCRLVHSGRVEISALLMSVFPCIEHARNAVGIHLLNGMNK